MNRIAAFGVLLVVFNGLVGCSTLGEVISPNDTSTGYAPSVNERGETVYRRERSTLVSRPSPAPTPEPIRVTLTPTPLAAPTVKNSSQVERAETDKSGIGLGFELSSNGRHSQIGVNLLSEFGFVEGRLGASLFKGSNDLYAGFELGARPKIKFNQFAIFGGLGIYGGDTKSCSTQYDVETCEKKFLLAGYLEAGITLWNISLFSRGYKIEEAGKQIPSENFFGIGIQSDF